MAIKLRLARYGTHKKPFYRLVAADSAARRDGRFLEQLGTYDPAQQPPKVSLDRERIKYWQSVGATPSDTVHTLLKQFMNAADTAFRPSPRKVRTTAKPAPAAES